jgi:hemerythrin
VLDVQKKYNAGATATLSVDVTQFLNWLITHIQGSDQSYRPHLNSKGIH